MAIRTWRNVLLAVLLVVAAQIVALHFASADEPIDGPTEAVEQIGGSDPVMSQGTQEAPARPDWYDDADALTGPYYFTVSPGGVVYYDIVFENWGSTTWWDPYYYLVNVDSGVTFSMGGCDGLAPGWYCTWQRSMQVGSSSFYVRYRMYHSGYGFFGDTIYVYFTVSGKPAAPTGLTAVAQSASSIKLTWTDNSSNESGFNVYRWINGGWGKIAVLGANVTTYTDSGLQPNTRYDYAVSSYNGYGESWSSAANATTLSGQPAAPNGLTAAAQSTSSIKLTWTDNASNENGSNVYRWINGSWGKIATLGANVTTYTDTSLQPNTRYDYAVTSYNGYGEAWSSAANATTQYDNATARTGPFNFTLDPNQTVTYTVSLTNSGTSAWSTAAGYLMKNEQTGTNYSLGSSYTTGGCDGLPPTWYCYWSASTTAGSSGAWTYYYRLYHGGSAFGDSVAANFAVRDPTPTSLSASPLSPTSIHLTWLDNSSTETGFKIYRYNNGWQLLSTVGAGTTAYNVTGLQPNTTYWYVVTAFNSYWEYWSASASATTPADPMPPTNLSAIALSSSSIRVNWQDNSSNEVGFKIFRYNGSSWTLAGMVGANVIQYTETGLLADSTYYYSVASYHSTGSTWASGWTYAKTLPGPQPPPAATNLSATALSSSVIQVNWQDNATTEDGYKLLRYTGSTWQLIATVPTNTVSYNDTGLNPNTTYYYTVVAYNSIGSTWPPSWAFATTLDPRPLPPTNTTATALSSSSIQVNWQDNAGDETGYRVYRYTGSAWQLAGTLPPNASVYTDTGLNANTTYYYAVAAYNTAGERWASGWIFATTLDPRPAAPTNVSATAQSTTSIQINWQDNATNESGYRLYRYTGSTWQLAGTVPADTNSFTDTGLSPNTGYYYAVAAYNSAGERWASGWVFATTLDPRPAVATNINATPLSTSSIMLTWTDNATNEDGYRIYRWTGSAWQLRTSLSINSSAYTDTGLAAATTYFYSVVAYNSNGENWPSGWVFATTY